VRACMHVCVITQYTHACCACVCDVYVMCVCVNILIHLLTI